MGYVCEECGLDYDTVAPGDMPVAIRSFPRRFRELFDAVDPAERDEALHRRPEPGVWSAVEYTAHVAAGFETFADTFERWLGEEHPTFDFVDPDDEAEQGRFNEREPDRVLDDLQAAADRLAVVLERIGADDWARTAGFPWGERDLLTMARNAVHEGAHHRRDVERGLAGARGR
jgi:hypothetical protein